MARAAQTKLLVTSSFDRLRPLVALFRRLPWPAPLQRLTKRGLERLAARIPELAALIDQKARRAPAQSAPSSVDLSALLSDIESRDYQTRAKAAQALTGHSAPEALSALVEALRDRSVEVAATAATALAVRGGEQARTALCDVIQNEAGYYHPLARAAALHGLGAQPLSDAERAPLYAALRDLEAEVSIAAIAALSGSGSEQSAFELLSVVENEDGFYLPITRLAAARALERLPIAGRERLLHVAQREGDAQISAVLHRLCERTAH